MYMADVLTNFGLSYGAKEDAKLEARIQANMKIAEMSVLAKERAVQGQVDVEERMKQT